MTDKQKFEKLKNDLGNLIESWRGHIIENRLVDDGTQFNEGVAIAYEFTIEEIEKLLED